MEVEYFEKKSYIYYCVIILNFNITQILNKNVKVMKYVSEMQAYEIYILNISQCKRMY